MASSSELHTRLCCAPDNPTSASVCMRSMWGMCMGQPRIADRSSKEPVAWNSSVRASRLTGHK